MPDPVEYDSNFWELVWADEFDRPEIDSSKWSLVDGAGGFGNNELQYYTSRPENARVENGTLIIEARKEKYQGSPYTSAKLLTRNKGDWTYGKYEIRARLPLGQGIWPAIWMMPTDMNRYGGWPECGEIDIMELLGHEPGKVYGTIHYGMPWWHTGASYVLPGGKSFSDDYHLFGLIWLPGEIRWYVDGRLYQTQKDWFCRDPETSHEFAFPAPFDRDFYIQLNVAVGGNWPGYPDAGTVFPQVMAVDYVRVYRLKDGYPPVVKKPE